MDRVDLLLNFAGLLLWLGWRAIPLRTAAPRPATISGVLRQADSTPRHRWRFLGFLFALLGLRAVFYWRIGSQIDWVPVLDLGAVNLPFNSVSLTRMLSYSGLSFALTLAVFHLWLLLLSVINSSVPENEPWQRMVRRHLGWIEALPSVIKPLLPLVLTAAAWWFANPWLASLGLTARPGSVVHLVQQSLLVGFGTCLAWKYFLAGLLFLGVLNTYLYLGNLSFWTYIQTTVGNLVRPLRWLPLRWGRIDLVPLVALGLVWFAFTYLEFGLNQLFARLPL